MEVFHMFIITQSLELEKIKNYEIHIEPPGEMKDFFRGSEEHQLSLLPY